MSSLPILRNLLSHLYDLGFDIWFGLASQMWADVTLSLCRTWVLSSTFFFLLTSLEASELHSVENVVYSMLPWFCGFCYVTKVNTDFEAKLLWWNRSKMVKCPMSYGYWIAELGFKLRPYDSNIGICNHYAMLPPSKQYSLSSPFL